MSERPIVLIPRAIHADGVELLETECHCVAPWRDGKPFDDAEIRTWLPRAAALVVRIFHVGAAEIDAAPHLRVVAKHGVGVDNFDVDALSARRIPLVFTPGANSNAVAEHTIALLLGRARHLVDADAASRGGRFEERDAYAGVELAGKTLGIVGLGRIGSRVARKAAGLDMNVLAYDPYIDGASYDGPAELVDELASLLAAADALSLHVPLTEETYEMIDAHALAQLKPSCIIINTSRGSVIDETALVEALDTDAVAGAALDVFTEEPLTRANRLCRTRGTLLSPHVAAATPESRRAMAILLADGVLAALRGERPTHVANEQIYDQ